MSKISHELKVLLYLNQRSNRTKWVTIKEIADYLEVSDRQARRYLEDLNTILEIDIETKLGRYGGYRLRTPLDKGFAMPENIVLAMSIAMRSNERIEKVLFQLPNYVITDLIAGDNYIDNDVLDNLEQIIKAIQVQKVISFMYRDFDNSLKVVPYKIVLTNHTYYLFGTYNDELRKYDVRFMRDIKQAEAFMPKDNIEQTILKKLSMYGIKDGKETTLRVKCNDQETLLTFDKYFEGKGTKDEEELTYTVTSSSENELYYPLFRISTKKYTFLDKDFMERYLNYLNNHMISIKRGND